MYKPRFEQLQAVMESEIAAGLYHGAVVKVAQGKLRPAEFAALLDQGPLLPRGKSPLCAPADGLFLQQVLYPDEKPGGDPGAHRALQWGRTKPCLRGDNAGTDI